MSLPDECWESIFKFLLLLHDGDGNDIHRCFESLSLVSKHFLSITNRLRSSLTISDPTLPFLPNLFHRFPNLTSLHLTRITKQTHLHALLSQISTFPFNLNSLKISNQSTIPANGLQTLSKTFPSLKSLTCSNIDSIHDSDLALISDSFPFLEELDLSNSQKDANVVLNAMLLDLPNLRKVNLSGHYNINDSMLLHLCKNSEFLEEIVILRSSFITHDGIAFAIRERPGLRVLSVRLCLTGSYSNFIDSLVSLKGLTCLDFSYSAVSDHLLSSLGENGLPLRKLILQGCRGYSYVGLFKLLSQCRFLQYLDLQDAYFLNDLHVIKLCLFLRDLVSINISKCTNLTEVALFSLLRNCAKLSEVRMEYTCIGEVGEENYNTLISFFVNPQLKSLRLAHTRWLRDEHIYMIASVLPNLQLLDLSSCCCISEKGTAHVLREGSKIRYLNLTNCLGVEMLRMNFKVSSLEVLNLSECGIDDTSLYAISKSCSGLLQLDLGRCFYVTEKGVRQVVESCTQLREINLQDCCKVAADVVDSMVFIRPSLRKVTAPPNFPCSESKRKLFLRHGCLVC
ncbi:uncharacterized protein LOC131601124 isoform X1 [Vicia villosa]|uniref:uncharacterized protein LOC131601124 isoform X1 n=1 Tax=Vicia villosa TaxID=3911 RepID=UPI00273CD1B1|nr:uncharacterized protein LOC131601124 isoform X1 [Vicia villosa]XP_058728855.1 uncharacterized protein LOC131601124 isoform X1 [Vicia villosa]XP_058728856.1 uncharacterized protein LOC131601124 isoform X1 [Vicia villosa]